MRDEERHVQRLYRCAIRFTPEEHAELKDLAEKSKCDSVPQFVKLTVENFGKTLPRIQDFRQREIKANSRIAELEAELKETQSRLRFVESDRDERSNAHDKVVAEYRQTIENMGVKENALKDEMLDFRKSLDEALEKPLDGKLWMDVNYIAAIRHIKDRHTALSDEMHTFQISLQEILGKPIQDGPMLKKEIVECVKAELDDANRFQMNIMNIMSEPLDEQSLSKAELLKDVSRLKSDFEALSDEITEIQKSIAVKLGVPPTVTHIQQRIEELKRERDDAERMKTAINQNLVKVQEGRDELLADVEKDYVNVRKPCSFFTFIKKWLSE